MKTFHQLKSELSKLHDEIAMKDANENQEDELDIICNAIGKAITGLDLLDNGK